MRNCTIAIGIAQEAEQLANSIIDAIYKGFVSGPVVAQPLVMPHVKHVYVLLPFIMPYIKHAHLGLHIRVKLKGITTVIWFSDCYFAFASTMGYAGFKLSFGIIILLSLLTTIK